MQTSTARRWTPSQIRKALPFPKPRRALPLDRLPARDELALLDYLAEHADILEAPGPGATAGWLLVPAPAWALNVLAQIGAAGADLEPEALEDEADAEPGEDDEADADNEASHVRPDRCSRLGLAGDAPSTATREQRERYRRGDAWAELRNVRRALNAPL